MHVQPIVNSLTATLTAQASLAGDDPGLEEAVAQVVDLLGPALRQAALELAEQAAGEVSAQLADRTIDVVLVDGDPALRVTDAPSDDDSVGDEDFDARITLRLPPRLKQLIEDAADSSGESVNGFVVETLASRAKRASHRRGTRVRQTFDL